MHEYKKRQFFTLAHMFLKKETTCEGPICTRPKRSGQSVRISCQCHRFEKKLAEKKGLGLAWLAAPKVMRAIFTWLRCGAIKVKISADETLFMRGNRALRFAVTCFQISRWHFEPGNWPGQFLQRVYLRFTAQNLSIDWPVLSVFACTKP